VDFVRQFILAKSLNTPVPFDSARLFTFVQWHTGKTTTDPIEAFDAAIETNTSLLLGVWLLNFDAELIALDKAFTVHGQKLADLVIGISVGNEDMYSGFANSDIVEDKIRALRRLMDKHKLLFKGKKLRVGHTDIAKFAANPRGMDFIGMTASPFWNNESISLAKASFIGSLNGLEERAGQTEKWIAETGWPFSGLTRGNECRHWPGTNATILERT
jgi:glucan endo-1,3-beta-D-glucosidase